MKCPKCQFENPEEMQFYGLAARYIGEILLSCADLAMPKAEDWIKKAIEADTKNDMRFNLGRDYALYAELLSGKGDITKAKESLKKAIEIYKECGADGWVKKAEKEVYYRLRQPIC